MRVSSLNSDQCSQEHHLLEKSIPHFDIALGLNVSFVRFDVVMCPGMYVSHGVTVMNQPLLCYYDTTAILGVWSVWMLLCSDSLTYLSNRQAEGCVEFEFL